MTSKPVEVGQKRALTSTSFDYWAAHVGWAKIKKTLYIVVAVTSSGILKAKQKLGVTFNSDKLGGIDFTKFSKLTMCSV